MLSDEQVAELRRLLALETHSEWGNATHRRSMDKEEGLYTWRLFDSAYSLACALRNAAPALLSAHADAVRLREALTQIARLAKDTPSSDRYLVEEAGTIARAALRPAEQGGGA